MPEATAVIDQPKGSFPGMRNAADETAELGKLWSISGAPTDPQPEAPPKVPAAPANVAEKVAAPAPSAQAAPAASATNDGHRPPLQQEPTEAEDEKLLGTDQLPRTDIEGHFKARKAAEARRQKRFQDQIGTLNQQLTEAKKVQPVGKIEEDPRWQAIQKENSELSERLRVHDITSHPRFKAFYDQKITAQVDMAKRIVGSEHAERAATLLSLPDSEYRNTQLEELMGNLSTVQQNRLGGVVNALEQIQADRSSQIELAKADFDKSQSEARQRAEADTNQRKNAAETLFTNALKTFTEGEKALEVFQNKEATEANKEWNDGVKARIDFARGLLFGEQKPETLIHAAFSAAAMPGLVKSNQAANARITELEAQVKALTAAQPRTGGNNGGGEPAGNGERKPADPTKKRGMVRNSAADTADWMKETFADQEA